MLRLIDVQNALSELAKERQVFHAEDDFKHALAFLIQQRNPKSKIRLERPFRFNDKSRFEVDFVVECDNFFQAFELKYKTRKLQCSDQNNEEYKLTEQNARDWGRYDFFRDIKRVEDLRNKNKVSGGFALLLTNDENYWKERGDNFCDSKFNLTDGRILDRGKSLKWHTKTGDGTKKGRGKNIKLSTNFTLSWNDFSDLRGKAHGKFRYLLVEVGQNCGQVKQKGEGD